LPVLADGPAPRLALLADAHLQDGDPYRPEAQALARAVAEIGALRPRPDLILFAGDLAHRGNPKALALGREILADLPAAPLMVMGEGDGLPEAAAPWRRLFGEPWFSHALPPSPPAGERENLRTFSGGFLNSNLLPKTENRKQKTALQVLGLHTAWCPGPAGPVFHLGEAQRRWLARELARLNPATPLIILSHAPLAEIFRPWQQWTVDGEKLLPLLARFPNVLCVHGHVHGAGVSGQWSLVNTENRKQKTENSLLYQGLPATAWPLPQPFQGTPAALRPGLGPAGCGWGIVALSPTSLQFQPHLWLA
jgi:3',5'-cyclic AMP phosphodiesterase CpdA